MSKVESPFVQEQLVLTVHKFNHNGIPIRSYVSIRGGGMVLRINRDIHIGESPTDYMKRVDRAGVYDHLLAHVTNTREINYNCKHEQFALVYKALRASPMYRRYKIAVLKEGFIALGEDAAAYNGITTIPMQAVKTNKLGYWYEYHTQFKHRKYIANGHNTSQINPPQAIRYSRGGVATHNLIWKDGGEICYFLKGDTIEYGIN